MTKEYDLVILGGGIGGYVAAIRASQLGMKVAIVEKRKLGGTCLHHGCIPSKALLRTAELYRQTKSYKQFGIELSNVQINFSSAQARKNKVIHSLYQGVKSIVNKEHIDVYHGFGRILGPSIFSPIPGTISVEYENEDENTLLVPKNVLIATGSKPKSISELEVDGKNILHSDQALELKKLPKSMVIIGAGVIGIEWASLLQDLGVEVTVVESSETILIHEDDDIRKEAHKLLKARGIQFLTKASIDPESLQMNEQGISIHLNHQGETKVLNAEKILVSVGREANIAEIGLANTSIDVQNNVIVTNDMYQTKESHIYAIGDCIGGMQLAHVASAEGIVAVEHMAGMNPDPLVENNIPSCIYAYPEIARVGLTEQMALDKGYTIKVGTFPFQGIGKAHVQGETNGFTKVIVDKETEDILGVHMIGPHVTDMIAEAGLAKTLDATAWEMSKTIHPHPTLSEGVFEAALAVDDFQIHG